jgi:hypothetical protein
MTTQMAPNGIHSVWQRGEMVGQLVSIDGVEYWFLYPTYRMAGLGQPDVTIGYTLVGQDVSAFDPSHPAPPLQTPVPPAGVRFIKGTAVAGASTVYPFLVPPPGTGNKRGGPDQVDPQFKGGYVSIQSPDKSEIGRVVALLQTMPPAPYLAGEHWFMAPGKSQYSTVVGATTTVTFTGVSVRDASWWRMPLVPVENAPSWGDFSAGGFVKETRNYVHTCVTCVG